MYTARGFRGMVVAPHYSAAQAGLSVLKDGGTACEAAVAVAACLAVVYPHMTGIGGDSFWLKRDPNGTIHAIEACGASAAQASLSLYAGLETIPTRGPLAANTVAGTISGWAALLTDGGGNLTPARLLRDAIEYAENGVAVTAGCAETVSAKWEELKDQPGFAATFGESGAPIAEGRPLRQPALARTLRRLCTEGLDDFYRGTLASEIAHDLSSLGSPVGLSDLAAHRALVVKPLSVQLNGATVWNMPPPTQGLASLLILALFDRLPWARTDDFAHIHALVEATKQAFLVRDSHVGDPRYMTLDGQALLDDSAALQRMADAIDKERALPWPRPSAQGDTTWFGVADDQGGLVSAIQSTYFEFGAGMVLPGSGIIWQNRGASFGLAETGWNALLPGRKPFHTLNPALAVFDDGRTMIYGTMGGEGQPQTQAALFTRYARFGQPIHQAVAEPRWLLGRTWGENSTTLKVEDRFAPDLYAKLRNAGHQVELVAPFAAMMGHAGAVIRYPGGLLEGASDPRCEGLAAAW
jgi:gamma-glutamyltranspeptidase